MNCGKRFDIGSKSIEIVATMENQSASVSNRLPFCKATYPLAVSPLEQRHYTFQLEWHKRLVYSELASHNNTFRRERESRLCFQPTSFCNGEWLILKFLSRKWNYASQSTTSILAPQQTQFNRNAFPFGKPRCGAIKMASAFSWNIAEAAQIARRLSILARKYSNLSKSIPRECIFIQFSKYSQIAIHLQNKNNNNRLCLITFSIDAKSQPYDGCRIVTMAVQLMDFLQKSFRLQGIAFIFRTQNNQRIDHSLNVEIFDAIVSSFIF